MPVLWYSCVLAILSLSVAGVKSLSCNSCQAVDDVTKCSSTSTCEGQYCYTSTKEQLITKGCSATCEDTITINDDGGVETRSCCTGDNCNKGTGKLCDINGGQYCQKPLGGTVQCYSCENSATPNCTEQVSCQGMCYNELTTPLNGISKWTKGCSAKCETTNDLVKGTRTSRTCCNSEDLCNAGEGGVSTTIATGEVATDGETDKLECFECYTIRVPPCKGIVVDKKMSCVGRCYTSFKDYRESYTGFVKGCESTCLVERYGEKAHVSDGQIWCCPHKGCSGSTAVHNSMALLCVVLLVGYLV